MKKTSILLEFLLCLACWASGFVAGSWVIFNHNEETVREALQAHVYAQMKADPKNEHYVRISAPDAAVGRYRCQYDAGGQ